MSGISNEWVWYTILGRAVKYISAVSGVNFLPYKRSVSFSRAAGGGGVLISPRKRSLNWVDETFYLVV